MATFDQALTESALIVIPVLIFLLAVGWFKYSGDSGGPKADTGPPRPSNPSGPGAPSNPNVPSRPNNTNTTSPPNNTTNTPSPPNNTTNTTSPPNNTANTATPPTTNTTTAPDTPAGTTAGSDNGAGPVTAVAGGTGGGKTGPHFMDFGNGRIAAVEHDPDNPMQHTVIYDTIPNQNAVNPGVSFAGHTPPPTAGSHGFRGIPVSAVPNGNNGELSAQNIAQLNSQYPEPRPDHFGDRALSQDRVTTGQRGRSPSRSRNGTRSFSQGDSPGRGRQRSRRKRFGSMEVQTGQEPIKFTPDKKTKTGRSRSKGRNGRSRSDGKSPRLPRSSSPHPGKKDSKNGKKKRNTHRLIDNEWVLTTSSDDSNSDDPSGPEWSPKRDMLKGKDATAEDQIKERLRNRGSKGKSRVASPRSNHPDDVRREEEDEKDKERVERHRQRGLKARWDDHPGVERWLDQDDKKHYVDRKDQRDVRDQAKKTRKELDEVDKELDDIISKREEKKAGGGEPNKDGDQAEEEQLKKVREALENLKKGGNKKQIAKIQTKLDELDPEGKTKAIEEQKKKFEDERKRRTDNGLSDNDPEEDEFFMKGPKMPKFPEERSGRSKKAQRRSRQGSRLGYQSANNSEDDYTEYNSDNPMASPGNRDIRGAWRGPRSRRLSGGRSVAQSHATTRTGRTFPPHASPTGRSRAPRGGRGPNDGNGRFLRKVDLGEAAFSGESGEESSEPVSNRSEYSRISRRTNRKGSIDSREANAALERWEAEAEAIAVRIKNGANPLLPPDKQDDWYVDQVVLLNNLERTRPWMREGKYKYWKTWSQDTRDALQTAKEEIDRSKPEPKEEARYDQGPEPIAPPSSKSAASGGGGPLPHSPNLPAPGEQPPSSGPREGSPMDNGPREPTKSNTKKDPPLVELNHDRQPPGSGQNTEVKIGPAQPSAANHPANRGRTNDDTSKKVLDTAQWENNVTELKKSIMEERRFSSEAQFTQWSDVKQARINDLRKEGIRLIPEEMAYSRRKKVNDMLNEADNHLQAMEPSFDPESRGSADEVARAAETTGKGGDQDRDLGPRVPDGRTRVVHGEISAQTFSKHKAPPERSAVLKSTDQMSGYSRHGLDIKSWKAEAQVLIDEIGLSLPSRSSQNEDDISWANSKDAEVTILVQSGRKGTLNDIEDMLTLLSKARRDLDIWKQSGEGEVYGKRTEGDEVVPSMEVARKRTSGHTGSDPTSVQSGNNTVPKGVEGEPTPPKDGKTPKGDNGRRRGLRHDGTLPLSGPPLTTGRQNGNDAQVMRAEISDPSYENWRSIWEEQWQKHWAERTQACNPGNLSEDSMANVKKERQALLDQLLQDGKNEAISEAAKEYHILTEFFEGLDLANESLTSKGLDQKALWAPSYKKWEEALPENKLNPAKFTGSKADASLQDPLTKINDLSPKSGIQERSKKLERQTSDVRRAKSTESNDPQDQPPDRQRGQKGSSPLESYHDHPYPPKKGASPRSPKTLPSSRESSPSWYDPRPVIKGTFSYIMRAKLLCTVWIAQFALSILGIRQLSALVTMPRGTDVNSHFLEKRATDDVPVDIQFTQKWLSKLLGDSNNSDFAFILLVVWISLCILTSGIIYNMIIEKVENPSTEAEKDGKWSQAIKMYSIRVWKGIRSFLVASTRVLLMDRHPSWSTFSAGFGWWTFLRIGIFVVQLLVILSVTRHVIATASLIADPENPYPSGLELKLTLPMIKDAMPTMSESPNMTMLLMVIVLSGIIIIGLTGWHALLHPRATAPQTSKMIGTIIHGSGSGYQAMVAVIAIVLVLSFSACLVFFVQIMQSVTELNFIKNGGYGDNVGLVGGLLIFGIFVPPLAWVCMEVWDILCTRFRRSGTPAAQRYNT